jgi:hypothetical protein
MGYAEKLCSRYFRDLKEAALYKEAMAIRRMKERNPDFFIFAIDGREFTPEQLRASLDNEEESYGAVDKWYRFIDSLPDIAAPYVDGKDAEKEDAVAAAVAEKEAERQTAVADAVAAAVAEKEAEKEAAVAAAVAEKDAMLVRLEQQVELLARQLAS